MRAALVTAFGQAPRCADIEEPIAAGPDQVVVEVLAAALSPRVRSQADGSHYTSTGALPVVPGIDGVGRLPDGGLVYFLLPGVGQGSMAERVAIDWHRSVALPDDADPAALAAAMNPAMASWVALRRRTEFRPGQRVLVLGATGSAGRAAVEVAHRLGAGDVVAAGRRAERMADLPEVGATRLVELGGDPAEAARALAEAGRDVDVVLDFLWGEPTRAALLAIIPARTRDEQTLTWIQIGSVAGRESSIPSAALRAVDLRLVGSGQGSVGAREYRDEIEVLSREIRAGAFRVPTRTVALTDVEVAWNDRTSTERLAIVP